MSDRATSRQQDQARDESLTIECLQGGLAGRRLQIDGRCPQTLGRSDSCDIMVVPEVDRMVSGRHLQFSRREGRWWVVDLGSSNGTTLNGRPLTAPTEISPGDILELGTGMTVQGVIFQVLGDPAKGSPPPSSPPSSVPRSPSPTPNPQSPSGGGLRRMPDGSVVYLCPSCRAEQVAPPSLFGSRRACEACGTESVVPIPLSLSPRATKPQTGSTSEPHSRGFIGDGGAADAVDRLIGDGLRRIRAGVGRMRSAPRRRELEQELADFERRLNVLHENLGRHLLNARGQEALIESSRAYADAAEAVEVARSALDSEQARIDRALEEAVGEFEWAKGACEGGAERIARLTKDLAGTGLNEQVEARRAMFANILESIAAYRTVLGEVPARFDDPTAGVAGVLTEVSEGAVAAFGTMMDALPDASALEAKMAELLDRVRDLESERDTAEAEAKELQESLDRCEAAVEEAEAVASGPALAACRARVGESERILAEALAVVGSQAVSEGDALAVSSDLFSEIEGVRHRVETVRAELETLDGGRS